jgi:2,4-dienoyl-CoA reductase-like NADH-dependent reductase (Old Yellow Enzyme family)
LHFIAVTIFQHGELPMNTDLFSPLQLRDLTIPNRVVLSPMCQYSSRDGFASDWHLVHLGSRATGGVGLIMTEAASIEPRGRISPQDLGIWHDDHIPGLLRITRLIKEWGSVAGIQLAHAGRKAGTYPPWVSQTKTIVPVEAGGWNDVVGPIAVPFTPQHHRPRALDDEGIQDIARKFREAARRSLEAGFEVAEIHAAHGYLIHQFLSPVSNQRTDKYGGPFENRIRFLLEITVGVREVWPKSLPLFVRISATDWTGEGWQIQDSVKLALELKKLGVDLIDCSSGGTFPQISVKPHPGYHVPFARQIREATGMLTGAVGLITDPTQADEIIQSGAADLVFIGRELLRNPFWVRQAAKTLKKTSSPPWPAQYLRAAN